MRQRIAVILALSLIASSVFVPGALAKPEHAARNQAAHWGEDCVKYDTEMGPTWETNGNYALVVLKSGRVHDEFKGVYQGQLLTTFSGKDISHIIVCGPGGGEIPN